MSDRATRRWTDKAAEAFKGDTGYKGDLGEDFVIDVLRRCGFKVESFASSKVHQIQGIDISVESELGKYTADVKANLQQNGSFWVELDSGGWLYGPRKVSDRIIHTNVDTQDLVVYKRSEMIDWLRTKPKMYTRITDSGKRIGKVEKSKYPGFIKSANAKEIT